MSTYLLAIGINHYTDRAFRALSCCENDASEIHALFKRNLELGDRASKLVGAVSIADVKNELRRIGREIRNGDTFVLFFAGHGYQHPKREDQFLLFPEAEARLVNKGYLDGMLSLSALCELTEHWAGVARVFILDACRSWLPGRDASGARFDNEAALAYIASRDPAGGPDQPHPANTIGAPGGALPPVILNATRNGQEAKELEDHQRGVLALALEQTLESQHKSGDVIWLAEQMLTDVNRRMNELLQHGRLGVEQTPFLTPPSARVLLFKPQRTVEAPNTDDDETEWAIACAKKSIEAYESYARRKPPGKYRDEALRCIGEIASNDTSQEIKHPRKNPPKKKQIKDTTPAPIASPTPTATAAPVAPNFVLINSIGEIASNDASQEQEAKAKRDEARREHALASDDLAGWQEASKEAETEVFRSEAHGKIAWLEREAGMDAALKRRAKLANIVGWPILAAVVSYAGILFFSGENRVPSPSAAPAPYSPLIEEKIELVKPQPNAARQQMQAAATRTTPASNVPEIAMVRIPGGSFTMGNPSWKDQNGFEGPQRTVNIRAFKMGKYEVTQGLWKAVMGSNPSHFSQCGDDCPVENVSWDMVQDFLKKLNALTGSNYRLPSEAEWEYAARAGTTGPFSFTGQITAEKANYESNRQDDGTSKGSYRAKTLKVGSLPANPWGLHEVHGNVDEWVQDCWHDSYRGAPEDGQAWETSCTYSNRMVLRGGSWDDSRWHLRSTARGSSSQDFRHSKYGFRLARTLP